MEVNDLQAHEFFDIAGINTPGGSLRVSFIQQFLLNSNEYKEAFLAYEGSLERV